MQNPAMNPAMAASMLASYNTANVLQQQLAAYHATNPPAPGGPGMPGIPGAPGLPYGMGGIPVFAPFNPYLRPPPTSGQEAPAQPGGGDDIGGNPTGPSTFAK